MTDDFKLVFSEIDKRLAPNELGDFIFLFSGIYEIAFKELKDVSKEDFLKKQDRYVARIKEAARSIPLSEVSYLFGEDEISEKLSVTSIQKESPLEIVFYGLLIAIVASAIIAGGKVEFWGLKAELNPLGDGIARLRESFNLGQVATTGYAVKDTVVKLSEDEFNELMLPLSGQGGFQNLFGEFQNRINKNSKKLPLYPSDIDKIRRYGHDPKKGGFQGRVRKVFGRHVNFD